jgi:hypothetical protein
MSMAYSELDGEPEPEKSSANSELMCESKIPAQFTKQLYTHTHTHITYEQNSNGIAFSSIRSMPGLLVTSNFH